MALIIHGKTFVREHKGTSAGFCPVCRSIRHFSVSRVGYTDHLYGIPVGRGKHVADELTCVQCNAVYGGAPDSIRLLAGDSTTAEADLKSLGAASGPIARMELEGRAQNRAISAEERTALLAEPFWALQYWHDVLVRRGPTDPFSISLTLLTVASIAGTLLGAIADVNNPMSSGHDWVVRCGIAAMVLAPACIIRLVLRMRSGSIQPLIRPLAASLAPLKPTPAEIEGVLEQLRAARNPIAHHLHAQRLFDVSG